MTRYPGYTEEITDPEVLADLQLRDASERDRGRTRPLGWSPPVFVEHWPCKGCGALVGMTKESLDVHAMFNRQLASKRESPLPKRGCCDDCKTRDEDLARMQADAAAAARRPHEQKPLELGGDQAQERPSGQRENRRRKP